MLRVAIEMRKCRLGAFKAGECGVQIYYELAAEREKQGKQQEVAIVRMEQLAPFPYDLVMREIRRYPNAEVLPALHCLQPGWSSYVKPPVHMVLIPCNHFRPEEIKRDSLLRAVLLSCSGKLGISLA